MKTETPDLEVRGFECRRALEEFFSAQGRTPKRAVCNVEGGRASSAGR